MKLMAPKRPMSHPSVTVVIPCYRYGHYLHGAVTSVLSQPGVDPRVIIVDDASPDDSAAIALTLAASDSRISVIAHPKNMGHIATYNDGLAAVETEFVSLVSADDLVAPGALARATGLMAAHPRVGMVYGHAASFHGALDEKIHSPRLPESWTVWTGREWTGLAARRGRNFILSPEVVLRTVAVRDVGAYSPALPHSGDLEFWLRTAVRWDVGRVNGRSQALYRVHGDNMHLTQFATMALDLRHRLAAFETLTSQDARFRDGDRLYARARQAIAREAVMCAIRELDTGAPLSSVRPLLGFAEEVAPGRTASAATALLRWRVRRADEGKSPAGLQRVLEHARRQRDRVRWRAWEEIGIS